MNTLFAVPVSVCLCRCLSHDTCTLIPDGCTGHNVSLHEFGEYLIINSSNETSVISSKMFHLFLIT